MRTNVKQYKNQYFILPIVNNYVIFLFIFSIEGTIIVHSKQIDH